MYDISFANLALSKGNVFQVSLNLEAAMSLKTLEILNEHIFALNKISVHRGLYLWTNLSWGMKVHKASAISTPPPPLIHDIFKNQTAPKWNQLHLLCSIISKKSYLHSRKTRLVWVTITFLNLEFPCLYFGNSESGLFHLRWKGNCSPSKKEHKIKNKSLISHTVAMGKITGN